MTRSVKSTSTWPSLEARSLGASVGRRRLLSGVSLALTPGRITVVLGPNGAGKSSLIRVLSGLLPPDEGEVCLDGQPISTLSRRAIAQRIAVVPQQIEAPEGLSVRELVLTGRAPYQNALLCQSPTDHAAVDNALHRCALSALADHPADRLSGGELRRALIARALAQQTSLLLLDEPAAHLDLRHVLELVKLVREEAHRGAAILAVIHDLPTATLLADDVLLLAGGRTEAWGPAREVLRHDLLEHVFGVELAPVQLRNHTTFLPVPSFS
ncbi:MAG: ABC transporter ATP-binding protein [Myxococcales bacterium]|nr:ABC transporter ATP-binding protein [Polyangiaceae bacterium]MDW8251162.1 ABC transporter ATP-binding protein [Myxococcales bacterium]